MAELRELYLTKCSDFACEAIVPIDEQLAAGASLEEVVLDGRSKALFNKRVQPMQVFALCETLYDYDKLTAVRLQCNLLNDMAAQAVARLLQVSKGMRLLDLTGNQVTEKGAASLAEVLSRPEATLQTLLLRDNPLGDGGVLAIAEMLKANKSLTRLDLADTQCGVKGLIGIAHALGVFNTTLTALDVGDAQLQSPQDSTYQHLARMLASNASLTELSLSKHRLVDSQLELLVTYGWARSPATWTSLSLRANRLSPLSGPTVERLVGLCPRLRRLDLSANALGNDGAIALARCLPYCTALEWLDVRGNCIGDVGLIALAGALPLVHTLQVFTVWGNNFGPGACRAMAEALASTTQLRTDVRPYTVDGEVLLAQEDL